MTPLILVSHTLCPYVQRVAITLLEKGLPFERRDIDLAHKPDWFLAISPLGKTPVLRVGQDALFESSAIVEYLDDCHGPRLHPVDALRRARHRAYMELGSGLLQAIGAFYSSPNEEALAASAAHLRRRLEPLEDALGEGPYFDGAFSLVDAVFGPVFRYFEVFDCLGDFGFWTHLPKLSQWRHHLAERPSVKAAVGPHYGHELQRFIVRKGGALAPRVLAAAGLPREASVGH